MTSTSDPGEEAPDERAEDRLARGEITLALRSMEAGDASAQDRLLSLVYQRLRRIAEAYMRRERPEHTMEPSDLVHEAYLRLFGDSVPPVKDRAHLYTAFASAARRVLVDHARARATAKRGGDWQRVTITGSKDFAAPDGAIDVLALHAALEGLSQHSERHARIVELRCFAGLKVPEVAEILGIGTTTVDKEWATAKAWLHARLAG